MFNYALGFIAICLIVMFLFIVDQAKEAGEANKVIESCEIVLEDKEKDAKIASRPDASVDELLERMRNEND